MSIDNILSNDKNNNNIIVRITQNGKIRNYVTFITQSLLNNQIVELQAEGRAINKLVTVTEVVKSTLPAQQDSVQQIFQSNRMKSQWINDSEESRRIKSSIFVTLSITPLS
jgi:DNA-binding protein